MQQNQVDFTRYDVMVEIRFTNGLECCEWCNHSYMNMKRHIECGLTHEEMACPRDGIGWKCPLRQAEDTPFNEITE